MTARLCLKARPTRPQLADRVQPIDGSPPDGLELYLDAADIADQPAMDEAVRLLEAQLESLPSAFALLIEGPVGSLDGGFFDVTRESEADRLVVERLAQMAQRLRVKAVNIHLIAPSDDLARLTLDCRAWQLRQAVPFLRHFVEVTRAAEAVPTIENMPPVLRMRQGGFFFTPIGMAGEDLAWMVEQAPGLELLLDTSHAGLYLNARRLAAANGRTADVRESGGWLGPLLDYLRQLPSEPHQYGLLSYFQSHAAHLANAQVSNAAGLLGEGLPYGDGDFDLDPVIRWLGQESPAEHLVTETLEPEPAEARFMRDALRRMRAALA